jgi:DNA-binding NtrC family response regulator
MHIDEHARLGATIIEISDLKFRREDLVAVAAVTLARMAGKFKTWKAPTGFSNDAWDLILKCNWRGNVRSLMRVVESAIVGFASTGDKRMELQVEHIRPVLELWEPEDSKDSVDYATFGKAAANP